MRKVSLLFPDRDGSANTLHKIVSNAYGKPVLKILSLLLSNMDVYMRKQHYWTNQMDVLKETNSCGSLPQFNWHEVFSPWNPRGEFLWLKRGFVGFERLME